MYAAIPTTSAAGHTQAPGKGKGGGGKGGPLGKVADMDAAMARESKVIHNKAKQIGIIPRTGLFRGRKR